jgi:hypothetical protein
VPISSSTILLEILDFSIFVNLIKISKQIVNKAAERILARIN